MKSFEIQDAIRARLAGDVTLSGLSTGVFDNVPPGQPTPYVQLGDTTEAPDDLLIERGAQTTYTLHIWDDQPSFKRVKQIMDRTQFLLHDQPLTVAGTQIVRVRVEFSQTFREEAWRRGLVRVRLDVFGS